MTPPLITLTTDFGDCAPYVAAMKGVILAVHPAARLLDLSHRIRPHDLRHASYFLTAAVPYFPPGTIHVCVVDPGVGSDRAALCVEAGGQLLLAPDNGVLTGVLDVLPGPPTVRRLDRPEFWRPQVSRTFHGRDIFAPVAAHLSRGVSPADVGTETAEWVVLPSRPCGRDGEAWEGEVQFVDDFGNLITNLPFADLPRGPVRLSLGNGPPLAIPGVGTYSDAPPGKLVALGSSDGFLEIAVVNGNAASSLVASVGLPVRVEAGE